MSKRDCQGFRHRARNIRAFFLHHTFICHCEEPKVMRQSRCHDVDFTLATNDTGKNHPSGASILKKYWLLFVDYTCYKWLYQSCLCHRIRVRPVTIMADSRPMAMTAPTRITGSTPAARIARADMASPSANPTGNLRPSKGRS